MRQVRNVPFEELMDAVSGLRAVDQATDQRIGSLIAAGFPLYFPFDGAAIYYHAEDWPSCPAALPPGSARCDFPTNEALAVRLWSDAVELAAVDPRDELYVIWDSAHIPAVCVTESVFRESIAEFLSIPAHMYVVPPDVAWCACFRFEGDMGFGWAGALSREEIAESRRVTRRPRGKRHPPGSKSSL